MTEQGEPGAKDLTTRIKSLIEDQGGTVSQVLEWGTRELAYPIGEIFVVSHERSAEATHDHVSL